MAKFVALWGIEGLGNKSLKPGDVFDAKPEDVKCYVSEKYGGTSPSSESAALIPLESLDDLKKKGVLCQACGKPLEALSSVC